MCRQIPILLLALLLTACQPPTKEDTGTVIGTTVGAIVGSQIGAGSGRTVAIIVGSLLGGYVGRNLGAEMDRQDRIRAAQALETNPTQKSSTWVNPDTGVAYRVTPIRTYPSSTGPCREFRADMRIGDRRETLYGTACRQPDGTWRSVAAD